MVVSSRDLIFLLQALASHSQWHTSNIGECVQVDPNASENLVSYIALHPIT